MSFKVGDIVVVNIKSDGVYCGKCSSKGCAMRERAPLRIKRINTGYIGGDIGFWLDVVDKKRKYNCRIHSIENTVFNAGGFIKRFSWRKL